MLDCMNTFKNDSLLQGHSFVITNDNNCFHPVSLCAHLNADGKSFKQLDDVKTAKRQFELKVEYVRINRQNVPETISLFL